MKVRELFEAGIKGPGDFWPGDELNPRSPDYNPPKKRIAPGRPDYSDYVSPEDREWEHRMRSSNEQAAQYKQNVTLQNGKSPNGQPYNVKVTITGPSGWGLKNETDKFLRFHQNIYHNFVDIITNDVGDGVNQAIIYIQAKPQSLLLGNIG